MIENPFATSFVRPGKTPFLFPPGEDADALVRRLQDCGWWGQITGQHGAGKSTLLHTLRAPLERAGREICWLTLRQGQRRLEISSQQRAAWSSQTLVIVDGFEQLPWWRRWRLKRWVKRGGAGLLVTAHSNVNLPQLLHVETSLETALQVVEGLLSQHRESLQLQAPSGQADNSAPPGEISADAIKNSFIQHNGNIREMLFTLYDLYEQQRISGL